MIFFLKDFKNGISRFTDHPNVKCYFGHGGLLGLTEGVQSGVPMILMPIFGDQYSNAAAAQYRGVAIILEYNDFTEEKLRSAMDQIFNDTRYVSFLRLFLFLYHVCKRERERERV